MTTSLSWSSFRFGASAKYFSIAYPYQSLQQVLPVVDEETVHSYVYLLTNKGKLLYEDVISTDIEWISSYAKFVDARLKEEAKALETKGRR